MKILGNTIIYGKDTLTATPNLQIYNGDSTPSLMWDWRNDGSVFFNQNTLWYIYKGKYAKRFCQVERCCSLL